MPAWIGLYALAALPFLIVWFYSAAMLSGALGNPF
jgi:hypothetical protein